MTVQYLIDSENVGDFWIPLLELPAEETELIVFYTRNSPHMSYESLIRLKESNRTVTFIKCYEGTNALDFQLVSELGYRICENEEDRFVIVTNDTGFDAAVKYWRRRKKSVKRITGKEAKNPERRIREDLSSRHAGEKVSGAETRVPVRRYTAVEHDSDHDAHADAFHAEAAQDPDGRPSRANLRDAEIAAQPEFEETASTEESSFDTGEDLELDAYEPEDEALNEEAWAEDTADDLEDADADDFEDAFADAEDTADGFDGAFADAEDIEDDFEDADAEDLLDPDTEDYAEPEETAEYVEEPARDLTAEDSLEKTGSAESLIEEPVERAASQAQIAQAYADMWEEDTETGTVSGEVPGVGDTALLIESQQLDFIAQVAPVPEGSPEIEEGPDAGRDAQVEYSASEEPTAVSAAEEPTAESAA
ncbi:MAG: PIN domain-containing protein, partial [Eubacteriales bacterium]|nr:PIN domain-containing protein [Eubacteriales bacterium]